MQNGRSTRLGVLAIVLVLSFACDNVDPPMDLSRDPTPEAETESRALDVSASVSPVTPEDSAAFLARREGTSIRAMSDPTSGIPVSRGDLVQISVVSTDCAAGDNVISVSGPVSQVLYGNACYASQSVALGPMPGDGLLQFSISGATWGDGQSAVSGAFPTYSIGFDDGYGDGDFDDIVLSAVIKRGDGDGNGDGDGDGNGDGDGSGGGSGATKLECSPSPVQRGQTVVCTLTGGKAFTVLKQRASGKGFSPIEEFPNASYPAGGKHLWQGHAITDASVSIKIQTTNEKGEIKEATYSADIDVQPRTWPTLQLKPPTVTQGMRGRMLPYPSNGVFGNAGPKLEPSVANTLPILRADAGPNKGLAVLADPMPGIDHTIYLHPGLYNRPSASDPPQLWYQDQNGQGTGTCTQSVFSILTPEAERHEGVTMAANSHWGITSRFYQISNAGQKFEQLFTEDSDYDLRKLAYDAWWNLQNGTQKKQQTQFDQAEYQAILAKLGCRLDMNPNDR